MPEFAFFRGMRRALLMIQVLLSLLILAFYLIVTCKSREFLQEVASKNSIGQYKLRVSKVEFFYCKAGIKAEQLKLIPVDSAQRRNFAGKSLSNGFQAGLGGAFSNKLAAKLGFIYLDVCQIRNESKDVLPFNPNQRLPSSASFML